jgi:polyhydroxyalkanoate synthesis regulator phasin
VKRADKLIFEYVEGPMTEDEKLTFYREAYEKAHKRAEALEKSNERLYERDALHTESSGMQAAEIRSLKARVAALEAQIADRETATVRGSAA